MPLIGYARVSTDDQVADAQSDVLKAAGCVEIFREHMSGAKASRPELAKALARVRRGDALVVARLDRLARSLSHLLAVIAELDAKGAHFKSLAGPIDTTTPQGRFALQVLGAVAELERALIQERTDCAPRRSAAASAAIPSSAPATATPLIDPDLLHRAASRKVSSERLVTLVAGIKQANPDLLAQTGAQLAAMYERTPRGGTCWSPSSVKSLLDRAEKLQLLDAETL